MADRPAASPNLDGAIVHSKVPTGDYYENVNNALADADSYEEVVDVLNDIRSDLLGGVMPGDGGDDAVAGGE